MVTVNKKSVQLFSIETGPLICSANQWTGFFMIETSVMTGFKTLSDIYDGAFLRK